MRLLVTGGAGFIGSTLVDRLLAAGHDVLAVDDLSRGSLENLATARASRRFAFLEADILDGGLDGVVGAYAPDVVYHLAAQVSVTASVVDPVRDAQLNVLGSLRVFDAALAVDAKVVVATSAAIYGDVEAADLPISEDHPLRPLSPYGISKMVLLPYLAAYERQHGLRWSALALANVYGPRQRSDGEGGVVARFLAEALTGRRSTVFGDGEQTRDFVFVADVADAFLAAAGRADGMLVNVGSGTETSLNALVEALSGALGVRWATTRAAERTGELRRSCLDVRRAHALLGWRAEVSLGDGLAATLAAMRPGDA